MSERAMIEITGAHLAAHPALQAWRKLQPGPVEPNSIRVLQTRETARSCRLEGAGPGGSAVYARWRPANTGLTERTVYQDILARLPIGALRCYGFVHAQDPRFGWLFLEAAGGEAYLPTDASHRALATQWVGRMHMGAASLPAAARLPDRGARHYLEHLRTARETICGNVTNPALNTDDGHVLEAIVSQLNLLEARWSQVESFCDRMPGTLVHGDFVGKNMNIRTSPDGLALMVFDWETAGWGTPAADVAKVDLDAYWAVVRECWGHLDFQEIQRLSDAGRIFRLLAAIYWASRYLPHEWVWDAMQCLRQYQTRMADAMRGMRDEG